MTSALKYKFLLFFDFGVETVNQTRCVSFANLVCSIWIYSREKSNFIEIPMPFMTANDPITRIIYDSYRIRFLSFFWLQILLELWFNLIDQIWLSSVVVYLGRDDNCLIAVMCFIVYWIRSVAFQVGTKCTDGNDYDSIQTLHGIFISWAVNPEIVSWRTSVSSSLIVPCCQYRVEGPGSPKQPSHVFKSGGGWQTGFELGIWIPSHLIKGTMVLNLSHHPKRPAILNQGHEVTVNIW